jgi:hypothetical protein
MDGFYLQLYEQGYPAINALEEHQEIIGKL